MKVSYEHVIEQPIEKVLDAYRSSDFYEAKQKATGALDVDIKRWEVDDAKNLFMAAHCTEKSRLPSFLRKSDVEGYLDEGRLDATSKVLEWKIIPDRAADKFFLSGKIEFIEDGDKTRVIYNTVMEVKMPLVGKKAEKIGLSHTEQETASQAGFLRKWLAEH